MKSIQGNKKKLLSILLKLLRIRIRLVLLFLAVSFLNLLVYQRLPITVRRFLPRQAKELRRWSFDWMEREAQLQDETRFALSSDEIYLHVICLSREPERRRQTEFELKQQGVQYSVFEAVDGSLGFSADLVLKYAGAKRTQRLGFHTELIMGHRLTHALQDLDLKTSDKSARESLHESLRFGCYLSHVFLWQKLFDARLPFLTIIEDDVELQRDFSSRLTSLLIRLPTTWDLVYLDGCFKKFGSAFLPGLKFSHGGLCTHGYVMSFKAAKFLLRNAVLKSDKPIDHLLDEEVLSGRLIAFHADPPLVLVLSKLKSTLAYMTM
jgi:GR25 family glycosyltransferase involved in LPS biosynthesis